MRANAGSIIEGVLRQWSSDKYSSETCPHIVSGTLNCDDYLRPVKNLGARTGSHALFSDATLYLALITFFVMLVLPKGRAFLATLGFRQQDNWLKTLGLAVAGYAAVLAVQTVVANMFPAVFLRPGGGFFAEIEGNTPLFLYSIASGIVIGGFVEEMLFRGYLLTRLIRVFGDSKAVTFAIVTATSLIFAPIHAYQGAVAVVLTGIFSFVVGLIFVRRNYNLWLVIIIHSIFNIVTFTTL